MSSLRIGKFALVWRAFLKAGSGGATEKPRSSATERAANTAPSISLPKGGGAIRGIGEKFTANPVNGTGSFSVPIATSANPRGLGPELALTYDSGAGNSPFGLGWDVSLQRISRRTDKGLPLYRDSEESDVFVFLGAEDLVPKINALGEVEPEALLAGYQIRQYLPRIEGSFLKIERWTSVSDKADVHWRVISKDNVLSIFGGDPNSRIYDPDDHLRVFSWLISEVRDDKGNAVIYRYKAENGEGIDPLAVSQRNRGSAAEIKRTANRYIKSIHYGNRSPLLDAIGKRPAFLEHQSLVNSLNSNEWMFRVLFDYGEHGAESPGTEEIHPWAHRKDAFSTYRSGFEVRTARLCKRVLCFHNFPDAERVGTNCLVRSTELSFAHDWQPPTAQGPEYAKLVSISHAGFRRSGAGYVRRAMPPGEFEYSEPQLDTNLHEVGAIELEGFPSGAHAENAQWVDLHGEGIPGLLSEDPGGEWRYKRNLSTLNAGSPLLGAQEIVRYRASLTLSGSRAQFSSLSAEGGPDIVVLDRASSLLFRHDDDESWEPAQTVPNVLSRDIGGPDARLIDLDGDGRADLLVTEDNAIVWYRSLGNDGFEVGRRLSQSIDEELGPRVVFSATEESIYLADMNGDGLSDIVRVRNGDVCYWPNLGHGRFGAKIAMENAPRFDHPDQFKAQRLHLSDIDGTGPSDLIYLHRDGPQVYFNRSGNGWSAPSRLPQLAGLDDAATVTVTDLLGNGTACLVWSSKLPEQQRRPMRYVRLMGDQKPHLLTRTINNLGAETRVHYAPSTKFYLQDKRDGRPWITKLPFPVHVVENVETIDHISRNRFTSRYAYHHGYFDKFEREFRGFGFVEQWDSEALESFSASSSNFESSNWATENNLPAIHTKNWFHTGQYLWRDRVSNYFSGLSGVGEGEYFRPFGTSADDASKWLLADTLLPDDLTIEEERDACRSLKGAMLRQEIYSKDKSPAEDVPYTVTEQNFTLRRMQPRTGKHPAAMMSVPREILTFHYERNADDPRIQHALTLEVDGFGNPLREVAIGYGRLKPDLTLLTEQDRERQTTLLIALKLNAMTNPVGLGVGASDYRTPASAETQTFEISGATLPTGQTRFNFSDWSTGGLAEAPSQIPYEESPQAGQLQKRLIEHVRILYRPDDLGASVGDAVKLLPLGVIETRGVPGETYQFAYTPGLLSNVYAREGSALIDATSPVLSTGGYLSSEILKAQGVFPAADQDGHWWRPSGRAFFGSNSQTTPQLELLAATQGFFVERRFKDPFGSETELEFDADHLFPVRSVDALGNEAVVEAYDYRVLQPAILRDPNGNRTAVSFDTHGLVAGVATIGKADAAPLEGDSLDGFDADLSETSVDAFFNSTNPSPIAEGLLKGATSRIVYDVGRFQRTKAAFPDDPSKWQPAYAATIARETHESDLAPDKNTKLQISFSFSDGFGREIQKKVQAEPGPAPLRDAEGKVLLDADGYPVMSSTDVEPRWVASGWTIFNNKGKPVRQYEPFFADIHKHEFDVRVGVSPVLFYDPAERVVATLHPNHLYEKVTYNAWKQTTFDASDTVLLDPRIDPDIAGLVSAYFSSLNDPTWKTWHQRRIGGALGIEEKDAAEKAAGHAGTPTTVHLDTLGRPFLSLAHNRVVCDNHDLDGTEAILATRTELDIEGNQLAVRDAVQQDGDAQGRAVMRFRVDLLGRPVFQHGMDGGRRWTLPDIADQPYLSWDERGARTRMEYDALRRPTATWLDDGNGVEKMISRTTYGESQSQPELNNLRTRPVALYDQAGMVTTTAYDFKGNALETRRELAREYKHTLDWSQPVALTGEVFKTSTRFDAMNRPIAITAPDGSEAVPGYNEAGLLERMDIVLKGASAPTAFVTDIDYDAKGQRQSITYDNGACTASSYDLETFRLTRLLTTRAGFAPDDSLLQDLNYTYDPIGNLTTIRDDAQQQVYFSNQLVEASTRYTYDALYRLIEAKGREHLGQGGKPTPSDAHDDDRRNLFHPGDGNAMGTYIERYVYDAVGNILQLQHRGSSPASAGWTRTFAYGAPSLVEPAKTNNRLTQTSLGNGTSETYAYDSHGNMLGMAHLPLMQWNYADQLQATSRQVVSNGGTPETTFYTYDASGERVRKITERQAAAGQVATRKSERIYLGGFEIYREYAADGETVDLERETLHVMDDERRIALVETRTKGNDGSPAQLIRYQMGNHIGSSSLELDAAAAIISYEEYLPYGSTAYQATRNQSEAPKRYRYTGKERDDETGLNYHSARYYAPWLTRWVSVDPIGVGDGVNVYGYCKCNPSNFKDKTGEGREPIHYYTTLFLALSAGYDKKTALKMALYSQMPDEVKEFDAIETFKQYTISFTSIELNASEPLPADAGRFVASEILKYRVVRDVAACGAEIPPSPEVSAPIAFFQFRELHLHPVGRTALHAAHEVADGNARRDFDEHVDMLLREHAGDDFHIQFLADLPDDRPDPLAQFTMQHLVAVFCDPDDVVTVVKNGMTSSAITHHLISEKGAYPPGPPFSEMR